MMNISRTRRLEVSRVSLESMPVGAPLEESLRSRSKGGEDSGNYRRNLKCCVEDFPAWLETDPQSKTMFER